MENKYYFLIRLIVIPFKSSHRSLWWSWWWRRLAPWEEYFLPSKILLTVYKLRLVKLNEQHTNLHGCSPFQEKFPPNIYYKIYTYRPVTDVNSFAPRDYTVSNWAAPGATVKNSKVKNPNENEGKFPPDLLFFERDRLEARTGQVRVGAWGKGSVSY